MLEIGRPRIACRGEVLILIGLRAGQPGLCYQHVNRRYVPFGKVKSIPWEAIATVDATDEVDAPPSGPGCRWRGPSHTATHEQVVCIETVQAARYHFRPMPSKDGLPSAREWALRFCQLADILGHRYGGAVGEVASAAELPHHEPWVAALEGESPTPSERSSRWRRSRLRGRGQARASKARIGGAGRVALLAGQDGPRCDPPAVVHRI